MFTVNIGLVILGMAIPIVMVFFWSKAAKTLHTHLEEKSQDMVLNKNTSYKFIEWTYHHKSKFHIIMIFLVSIIEFLALIPF